MLNILVSNIANEIISSKVVENSLGFLSMLSVKNNNIVLKKLGKHNKCRCKNGCRHIIMHYRE